jgi:purine-binding chemotaxis protein CheW
MAGVFDSAYLIGLGTLGERMLILVDIEKLMASPAIGVTLPRAA